jgi:hypothetical protein
MPASPDVEFTFSPASFIRGFKKITESVTTMGGKLKEKAKSISGKFTSFFSGAKTESDKVVTGTQDISKAVFGAMTKFAIIGGIVKGVFNKAVGAVKEFLPEIGVSLGIVKDIMFKNLFWPLRKQLLPILQGMIKWVQQNRGTFVKWGQVLANIFNVIVTGAKGVIRFIKAIFKGFFSTLKGVFGDSKKGFTEFINVLTFKLAVLAEFMGAIFEPIGEKVGMIFGEIFKNIKTFTDAVFGAFSKVSDGLSFSMFEDFKSLFDDILDIVKELNPAFRVLGDIVGRVLVVAFVNITQSIKAMFKVLSATIKLIKNPKQFREIGAELKGFFKESFAKRVESVKSAVGIKKVDDALIKKDGTVVKLNPLDNVLATKGDPLAKGGGAVSLQIGDINLNVTEGNASNAGQNFATGMMNKFKDNLILDGLLAGESP